MCWRNARFVAVADGRNDRGIERVAGFCPVSPSPFAPLDVIHRWWRCAYHRLMAWIPPGSRNAIERDCRRLFSTEVKAIWSRESNADLFLGTGIRLGNTHYYLGFRVA